MNLLFRTRTACGQYRSARIIMPRHYFECDLQLRWWSHPAMWAALPPMPDGDFPARGQGPHSSVSERSRIAKSLSLKSSFIAVVFCLEMAVACTVEGLLLLLSPRTFDHSEARSFAVNSERRGDQRFLQDHWLKMVRSSVGERRASRQRVKANEEAARLSWQTAPPNSVSSQQAAP